MKKIKIYALCFIVFFQQKTLAQIGIGPSQNFTPSAGAMLDVSSTNRGVLLPRIANSASINSPIDGLLFYNTTSKKFNYYDGAAWQQTYLGSQWNVNGNDISYSGLVGIGTNTPVGKLNVFQNAISNTSSFTVVNQTNSSSWGGGNTTIYAENEFASSNSNFGMLSRATKANVENIAFYGLAQQGVNSHYAIAKVAYTNASEAFGIRVSASNVTNNDNSYGIYASGFFGNYAGYFSGRVVVTGTFSNPSDEKLKKNMRGMAEKESMLNKVLKLKPLNYNYDEKSIKLMNLPTNNQYGFTAQNIEEQFPELVLNNHQPALENPENEEDKKGFDFKSVNYIQLIPILTQALQEQQILIEKLQKQVDSLLKK